MHAGAAIVGVAVWVFITTVSVAGIVGDYKRRRAELEPLRAAIERGQTIDPALLERLLGRSQREHEGLKPLPLRIGGIITIAAGVGLALMSLFLRTISHQAFAPVLGAATLTVCIGVGLCIAARTVERARRSEGAGTGTLPHGDGPPA